ncbi:hypothetical protein JCM8547_009401 [Rhodosporidiobolus lusitaniae]
MQAFLQALASQRRCSYALEVVQQPVRARMCGFGDKDRRPISPPLIVKLTARDEETDDEISLDDLDTTFLILAADLRTPDDHDANLILPPSASGSSSLSFSSLSRTPTPPRSSSSQHTVSRDPSPSSPPFEYPSPADSHLSACTTPSNLSPPKGVVSLPPPQPLPSGMTGAAFPPEDVKPLLPSSSKRRRLSSPPAPPSSLSFPPPPSESSSAKRLRTASSCEYHTLPSPSHLQRLSPPPSLAPPPSATSPFIPYARDRRSPASFPSALFPNAIDGSDTPPIPNLIGTLHTNAYKLKDLTDEKATYFVLPDLSVRTEGQFKLRLRLLSIGVPGTQTNTGTDVVATEHTDEFRVFSAKKFAGMLDPTPLSQCFAKQGVRIPTRKVAKSKAPAQGKAATMAAAAKEAAAGR